MHKMETKLRRIFIVFMLLHVQAANGEGPELYFHFFEGHPVHILENSNISISFWLDTSSCKDPNTDYRLEIQTLRSDGTYEYDGRLVRRNNKCFITYHNTVRCTGDNGWAELNKTVNRLHKEIVWRWSWMDDDSQMRTRQMAVTLKVIYMHNDTIRNTYGNDNTSDTVIEKKEEGYGLNNEEWATIVLTEVVAGISIISFILGVITQCNRFRIQTKNPEDVTDKKIQGGERGVVDRKEKENTGIVFDRQKTVKHSYIKQIMQWTSAILTKLKELLRWKPNQKTNKLHHHLILNRLQDESLCSLIPETSLASEPPVRATFGV